MRKDMPKCLVEDGRLSGGEFGRKLKRRHRRKLNKNLGEDSPKREPMSGGRAYGWEAKTLNETLKPLVRFLRSNEGRPWDKVYSEIRERLDVKNPVQLHIMEHLWQFVDRDVRVSDQGVPVYPRRWHGQSGGFTVNGKPGWSEMLRSTGNWPNFYIDDHGILRQPRARRYPDGPSPEPKVHRADGRVFVKTDGIWYDLDLVPIPDGWRWGGGPQYGKGWGTMYGPRDAHFGVRVGSVAEVKWHTSVRGRRIRTTSREYRDILSLYGRRDVYCRQRKQLSRKELRRHGLRNGA